MPQREVPATRAGTIAKLIVPEMTSAARKNDQTGAHGTSVCTAKRTPAAKPIVR